jgi:hypothetical protein
MDVPAPDAEQALSMTSTTPSPHAFAYVDSDVPPDQTLAEWRRERAEARRAERPRRRTRLIPRLRPRWAP